MQRDNDNFAVPVSTLQYNVGRLIKVLTKEELELYRKNIAKKSGWINGWKGRG